MKLQQKHRKIMGVVVLSAALTLGVICMDFIAPMSVQVWADTTIAGSWIQASDGRWWYRHADGSYTKSNWEFINGYWYYFDASGWMVTGWCKISEKWYYLSPAGKSPYIEGQRVTGWLNDGGRWYYLNPTATSTYQEGEMLVGWQKIKGTWYYLNPTANTTYKEGQMVTGWLTLNGKKYYLASDGAMLTGVVIMDGIKYTFASSGELQSQETMNSATGGDLIAKKALESITTPYVWGGKSLSTGCDNAGFVYAVMAACNKSVPETMEQQQSVGISVQRTELEAGDIVFYEGDRKMVAIYLGQNRVIYAASPRWGVRITTLDHPGKPYAYRRV